MRFQRVRTKDHVGALLLIALGMTVALSARTYRIGSLTEMGAGFIPLAIGILLIVVGALIAVTAKAPPGILANAIPPPGAGRGIDPRGGLCILGGIAAFVLVGTYGGLVPATFACVFIAAMGDRANSPRDAFLLAAALALAGYVIFSVGLKISLAPFSWG